MIDSENRDIHAEFTGIYEAWYDRIYKYAYTLLLNKEDAEDITAEVFTTALINFDRYDPEKASIGTWLTRIAHNRAVNLLRSAYYSKRDHSENAHEDLHITEDFTGRTIASVAVLKLYSGLTFQERELLDMRYVMELKDKEIAMLLDLQPKTVNKRIQRLLSKCRTMMNMETEPSGGN